MNRHQRIALFFGGAVVLLALTFRPIERRTTTKSGFVTYRDIAVMSPVWDWFITRQDSLSFSRFPYLLESPDGTRSEFDINWTFYLAFVGVATAGTFFAVRRFRNCTPKSQLPDEPNA